MVGVVGMGWERYVVWILGRDEGGGCFCFLFYVGDLWVLSGFGIKGGEERGNKMRRMIVV